MTSLNDIKAEFLQDIRFQETPIPFTDADYQTLLIQGLKRLYVDEDNVNSFDIEFDSTTNIVSRDLNLIEKDYWRISSEIYFYNEVKNYWSTLVSYTTNSISVAGIANVFRSINSNVTSLENRLTQLRYKFTYK